MRNILLIGVLLSVQACNTQKPDDKLIYLSNGDKKIEINPEIFSVTFIDPEKLKFEISSSHNKEIISDLVSNSNTASWEFKEKGIAINLKLTPEYLDVDISANTTTNYTWPEVTSKINAFTLPFHQGKYIPAQDVKWIEYLVNKGAFSGSQDLSMQFFATNYDNTAIVYIIKNMFNNEFEFFDNQGTLSLKFNHNFPKTVTEKIYGFRIYLTQNNPVAIAKTYKKYIEETGKILTLEEKAKDNANIRKLYGAPHIYIWNTMFFVATDVISWDLFKDRIISELVSPAPNPTRHIFNLFNAKEAESGNGFLNNMKEFEKNKNVIPYHKNQLCHAFNEALSRKDFFDASAWENIILGNGERDLLKKGIDKLNDRELFELNKLLLVAAYPDVFTPMHNWGGAPLSMLDELNEAGIKKAWMGLNDWIAGEMHPEFVIKAVQMGYLVGPYDDYHGIHEPGKEKWVTSKFDDTTLYSNAYILNEHGKPVGGFLGEGRKLNPVLSMPAVQGRVGKVMNDPKTMFNSWFIDCDATGEIFDDYTPGRMTTQKDDMDARLKRMSWIRDNYKLVIGSEVGNDFAANTIAFAHGMTTPVIAWNDPDMRKNKDSKFYIGGYYSSTGGVPDKFILQSPIKDKYAYTYYDNRFNIPLFQLVYNNAVITSHHWEWGSLKVAEEIKNNALKEILYNVPPLYHLNGDSWNKFKGDITKQVNAFSKTHEIAVLLEMTDFQCLTKDRFVQMTMFGDSLEIIANFGVEPYKWNGKEISGQSLLIHNLKLNDYEIYCP